MPEQRFEIAGRPCPPVRVIGLMAVAVLLAGLNTAKAEPSAQDDLGAALMTQVQKCWNPPPGATAAGLVVHVRMSLKPDGSLAAAPEVVEPVADASLARTFAVSSVRAIAKCAPYHLPPDAYEAWRDNVITFHAKP